MTDAAAERELERVLAERAAAWAQLQELRAQAEELAYNDRLLAGYRDSVSWRLGRRIDRVAARLGVAPRC